MQNLCPIPHLLNQNLHSARIPGNFYEHQCLVFNINTAQECKLLEGKIHINKKAGNFSLISKFLGWNLMFVSKC